MNRTKSLFASRTSKFVYDLRILMKASLYFSTGPGVTAEISPNLTSPRLTSSYVQYAIQIAEPVYVHTRGVKLLNRQCKHSENFGVFRAGGVARLSVRYCWGVLLRMRTTGTEQVQTLGVGVSLRSEWKIPQPCLYRSRLVTGARALSRFCCISF